MTDAEKIQSLRSDMSRSEIGAKSDLPVPMKRYLTHNGNLNEFLQDINFIENAQKSDQSIRFKKISDRKNVCRE